MRNEERRYPVLNTLSLVLKVLAVIVLAFGIIVPIAIAASGGVIISSVLVALFNAIILYALADLILVVIDIEHNTFLTSQELQSRVTPAPQAVPQERPEGEKRPAA